MQLREKEKLLDKCSKIIEYCGTAISLIHRGEAKKAKKLLNMAKRIKKSLKISSSNYAEIIKDAMIEYVEAQCLYHFAKQGKLPPYESLGVEPDEYLLGLADFIGELRRMCLEQIRHDNYKEASKTFEQMEQIYEYIWYFEYPKKVIKGLRRKLDINRKLIDETRLALTQTHIALTGRDLSGGN